MQKGTNTRISSIFNSRKERKLSQHINDQRLPFFSKEAWKVVATETDPTDFVALVLQAIDNDEGDKVIGIMCATIETFKKERLKPEALPKFVHQIFSNDRIFHTLSPLSKTGQAHNFRSKGNPIVPVLAANI
ncbi:integrator complex subunit 1 isoform X1 [Vespula maculifrons]|uniref:Integrator complex subunit 1 isoform X1 n=1 Tax=Vespula maculifrons TaxID=7453 RepID=A0ABD2CRY7_VESMC